MALTRFTTARLATANALLVSRPRDVPAHVFGDHPPAPGQRRPTRNVLDVGDWLEIRDTGGSKRPYRLDVMAAGAHRATLLQAGTRAEVSAAIDVLYDLAFYRELVNRGGR